MSCSIVTCHPEEAVKIRANAERTFVDDRFFTKEGERAASSTNAPRPRTSPGSTPAADLAQAPPTTYIISPALSLLSSSSYLPSLDDWAQDSGSSILISCIAQRGLVGVWLSFGDATGAIFACFLTLCVGFFIDTAVERQWVEEEDVL